MARKFLLSRLALAVALSGGMTAAMLPSAAMAAKKKDEPAKSAFSPEYAKAAQEIDKTITDGKTNATVQADVAAVKAATDDAAKTAARAKVDADMGGITAKLQAAGAVASTPTDKLKQGDMERMLGVYLDDPKVQNQGLVHMLDSGALDAANVPQVQYLTGVTAYQSADYANAAKYLKMASDSGYKDDQNLIPALLADSYKRSGNAGAALGMATQSIDQAIAAGQKPDQNAVRTALQSAYDAKQLDQSVKYAGMLAQYYPSPDTWNVSLAVVRQLARLPNDQNVDLMRLMFATGALKNGNDYLEYLADVDPRAYPGEAIKIIDAGVAAGKLTASTVAQDKSVAAAAVGADKASLPSQERDAMKPGAKLATVVAAGDAFLSYDQPAQAEAAYTKALGMPGVDAAKVALRLGMAQVQQGKYADAKTSFEKVTGPRASVAKMWEAYAASKAGA
ncbi:hypothetical protein [Novosphingobium sp. 9]|uniref:hypothetical protein n=1 Tax=Novosphingobium sp. 9 TaxID=2025349 RepID=UPI0021B6A359|nr:hypothetical protein [Novosphingobium sp. 9]